MADLFIMARVLHDWDEERDDVLLTKVFNSLTPGGLCCHNSQNQVLLTKKMNILL